MPIVLEYHNPEWAMDFAEAKLNFETILAGVPISSIEHVGNLVAKPVIDIDIVIKPENLNCVKSSLIAAGYIPLGECGIAGRHAFWQPGTIASKGNPVDGSRRLNTYVIYEESNCLRGHRDLKKVLLEDPVLRKEYNDEKIWLVFDIGIEDIEEYSHMKNQIVLKILRKAGWTEEDFKERREIKLSEVIEWDGTPDNI